MAFLASNPSATAGLRKGGGNLAWRKGVSGNPRGRPPARIDIAALARVHGPRCIEVAVELLDDPDSRIRLGALVALLDRGFGRPVQAIAADPNTAPIAMHLLAAQLVSTELVATFGEHTIAGHAEPSTGPAGSKVVDLLTQPPPTE